MLSRKPLRRAVCTWAHGALGPALLSVSSLGVAQVLTPAQPEGFAPVLPQGYAPVLPQGYAPAQPPAGLKFETWLGVTETYTDNVLLAPAGQEQHDWVTELSPRLRLSDNTPRLKANVQYSPDVLFYGRGYGTETRQYLNATGTGELMSNFLYLDAGGFITQQRGSPLGSASGESPAVNSNRLETRTYDLSPYIKGETSHGDFYTVRFFDGWTTTSSDLPNTQQQNWLGHIETPRLQTLGWVGDAEHDKVESTGQPSLTDELATLKMRYRPDPDMVLFATGGYEHNDVPDLTPSNAIYGGELDWRPSPRTNAIARWDRRFFGSAYLFGASQRSGNAVLSVSAIRSLNNFGQQSTLLPVGDTAALLDAALAATVPDPTLRYGTVYDTMLTNALPTAAVPNQLYYTQGLLVSELQNVSLAWVGRVFTTMLSAYHSKTRNLVDTPVVTNPTTFGDSRVRTSGVGLTVSWRVSVSDKLTLTGFRTWSESELPTSQSSNQSYARLLLAHIVNPLTELGCGIRYNHFNTDASSFSDYIERAVFVSINRKLW